MKRKILAALATLTIGAFVLAGCDPIGSKPPAAEPSIDTSGAWTISIVAYDSHQQPIIGYKVGLDLVALNEKSEPVILTELDGTPSSPTKISVTPGHWHFWPIPGVHSTIELTATVLVLEEGVTLTCELSRGYNGVPGFPLPDSVPVIDGDTDTGVGLPAAVTCLWRQEMFATE